MRLRGCPVCKVSFLKEHPLQGLPTTGDRFGLWGLHEPWSSRLFLSDQFQSLHPITVSITGSLGTVASAPNADHGSGCHGARHLPTLRSRDGCAPVLTFPKQANFQACLSRTGDFASRFWVITEPVYIIARDAVRQILRARSHSSALGHPLAPALQSQACPAAAFHKAARRSRGLVKNQGCRQAASMRPFRCIGVLWITASLHTSPGLGGWGWGGTESRSGGWGLARF